MIATDGTAAVNATGEDDPYGKTAAVVEINSQITGKYIQDGFINGVINSSVSNAGAAAVEFKNGGTLTVNGSVSNTGEETSAIYVYGKDAAKGNLTLKCATVTSDYAALYVEGQIASLNIKNSTLTSKNGSTIQGTGTVAAATIDGSRFVAKSDKKVKTGVTFTAANYDGVAQAENSNVLSNATGSYGTLVACDAAAEEPGEDEKGEDSENPNTADTIATYLTIATVALLGLSATAFVAKKSNR